MAKHYTSLFLLCAFTAPGTAVMAQHAIAPCIRDHGQPVVAVHAANPQDSFRSDPIWSDDFSDPSHWAFGTLNSTANNWVIGTDGPSGDYAIDTIMSTTAANGFALFDSDLMCGPDNGYVAIASSVDLSGVSHVQLQFEQFYRRFQGQTWVDVSADNVNWTSIEVNSQLTTGGYTANPAITSVDISAVAGSQPNVWFRFRYTGNCDYAWMVDDVALVEQPANEISLITASTTTWNFNTSETYDSVYYSIFPMTELRPLAVNMTVFNAGYEPATNVMAHITTSDEYDQDSNLGTIAPGDTLTWFGPLWTPTALAGTHSISFTAVADSVDADTTDNHRAMSIQVGNDFIMARDNGARQTSVGDGSDAYRVGNWFHLRNSHIVPGVQVALSSTSEVGVEVNGQILDANRQPIAETAYHTVTADDLSGIGEANFVYLYFDTPVQLDPGDYFVAFQHFGGVEMWVGASGLSADQSSLLYRASNDTWYSISPTPMVRLDVGFPGSIAEGGSPRISLRAWPNPAEAHTQVSFHLDKSTHMDLELIDINGRPVRTLASGMMAAGTHEVDVDTRSLTSGVYNCTLRTVEGVTTRRVVVMH
jgi:hypothetical protein